MPSCVPVCGDRVSILLGKRPIRKTRPLRGASVTIDKRALLGVLWLDTALDPSCIQSCVMPQHSQKGRTNVAPFTNFTLIGHPRTLPTERRIPGRCHGKW